METTTRVANTGKRRSEQSTMDRNGAAQSNEDAIRCNIT